MSTTQFEINDLKEGEEYSFRVRAINGVGPGDFSSPSGPFVARNLPEKPGVLKAISFTLPEIRMQI